MSETDMTSNVKKFLDKNTEYYNSQIENDLTGSDYTTTIENTDLMVCFNPYFFLFVNI